LSIVKTGGDEEGGAEKDDEDPLSVAGEMAERGDKKKFNVFLCGEKLGTSLAGEKRRCNFKVVPEDMFIVAVLALVDQAVVVSGMEIKMKVPICDGKYPSRNGSKTRHCQLCIATDHRRMIGRGCVAILRCM
jgi:hypothetical protein